MTSICPTKVTPFNSLFMYPREIKNVDMYLDVNRVLIFKNCFLVSVTTTLCLASENLVVLTQV